MKILVTGGTGLLGNNLIRKLLQQKTTVRAAVRTLNPKALEGLDVEQVVASFDSSTNWNELIDGCDAVIHCAAIIHLGWTRMEECRQLNVECTRQIAIAARMAGSRMVHVSSVDTLPYSVDGVPLDEAATEPKCPPCNYVVTKTESETAVHNEIEQGLDAAIVHPGFLIGPYDWKPSSGKMLLAIANRQIPLAPAGGCSVVDVRDVASALIRLAEGVGNASGEHYILGGHNLRYRDFFREIESVVGGKAPRWVLRPGVAAVGGLIGDTLTKIRGYESDFNSAMIRMGQICHFYDSSKAARDLGYSISPLRPALESAWNFVKDHHC